MTKSDKSKTMDAAVEHGGLKLERTRRLSASGTSVTFVRLARPLCAISGHDSETRTSSPTPSSGSIRLALARLRLQLS
jgi:hypothetical protein